MTDKQLAGMGIMMMRPEHGRNALLPVGQVVSYEDMANPRHEAVVTGTDNGDWGYGQACTWLDSGRATQVRRDLIAGPGGWKLVDRVMDGAELARALETAAGNRERRDREAAEAKAKDAQERAALRKELLAEWPELTAFEPGDYPSPADAARNLRKVLKREFPDVKFSVRSKSYSGGSSIDVGWTDGPALKPVKHEVNRFQGCDFDGMIDLQTYRNTVWGKVFGDVSYTGCRREVSQEHTIRVAAEKLNITLTAEDFQADYPNCLLYEHPRFDCDMQRRIRSEALNAAAV